MNKLFIVANWKSNMTTSEVEDWLEEFRVQQKGIVVCPSFTLLQDIKLYIINHKFRLMLGAQDISPFEPGAYTGEVNGEQIKEFAEYVIIGHSERRKNFHETDQLLEKKVQQSLKHELTPIFCVQDANTKIPQGVFLVAYEPIFAIGTGNPDTPENANKVALEIKNKNKTVQYVLYGGSVNSQNVHSFTSEEAINGVLVGGASLKAKEFTKIIAHA